jgi:DNA modification methylase
VTVDQVPIDALHPDPANPRRIGEAELEALCRSIQQYGLVQPVLARREDQTVIGGHQRLLAARKLGLTHVPVIFLDLSVEAARLLNLALNRIAGDWDEDLLARLLNDLRAHADLDLSLAGFGDDELDRLLRSLDRRERRERPEAFDLDQALEAMDEREPRTRPGDVWRLGPHRLACGDSTKDEDVARLLDGTTARMAFTDPPYNVDYGHHGGAGAKQRSIANDALDAAAWEAFCGAWARQLISQVSGALYVCMSSKEWPTLDRILREAGAHWSDTLIWAKERFVMGRADYQRGYEPVWYGWREGAERHWCGARDQSDVWQVARPAASDLHPTTKPLALVERAIENSSQPGDAVLDLFLGSGTTLIACERTGRVCYGLELDPRYVDIAVARWESFTGAQATKEEA